MSRSSFVFGGGSILWKTILERNLTFLKIIKRNPVNVLCNNTSYLSRYIQSSSAPKERFPLVRNFDARGALAVSVPAVNSDFVSRPKRKRDEQSMENFGTNTVNVTGYCTAEQYDLENLLIALREQQLYEPKKFFASTNAAADRDVLYASAKYELRQEAREVFFFRSGSVVLWNFNEMEAKNLLKLIKGFEKSPHHTNMVTGEKENISATYIPPEPLDIEGDVVADYESTKSFFKNGQFYISDSEDSFNHKYTLSDALSASIRLGIFEAQLERYITSIQHLTSDLSRGRRIRISRQNMLRKTGELFDLRHGLNLSSDLLDVPDFYWDRDDLEALYLQITSYYGISKRTKVMNEKINHCLELTELIYHNLNDKHHVRLEWMIIILIMVEVGFEIIHFVEKYYNEPLQLKSIIGRPSPSLPH